MSFKRAVAVSEGFLKLGSLWFRKENVLKESYCGYILEADILFVVFPVHKGKKINFLGAILDLFE